MTPSICVFFDFQMPWKDNKKDGNHVKQFLPRGNLEETNPHKPMAGTDAFPHLLRFASRLSKLKRKLHNPTSQITNRDVTILIPLSLTANLARDNPFISKHSDTRIESDLCSRCSTLASISQMFNRIFRSFSLRTLSWSSARREIWFHSPVRQENRP
jgi:hypothetical protein